MDKEWTLLSVKKTNELSFVFNERVANCDYAFMQYGDLVSMILAHKCKVLKKHEVPLIWYLHGMKKGAFILNDIIEYPNKFKKPRSKGLIEILLLKNVIYTKKKHSRINPNVFVFTKEFNAMMDELYKIAMCMKKVPITEDYLGEFMLDKNVIKLCLKQHDDCDVIKDEYMKYKARKR